MRPDYFFTCRDAQGMVENWAVECKGSHIAAHWTRQMRTAASQVANVLIDGNSPPALIFAAHLHAKEIVVRVLDPPSDNWRGRYRPNESTEPPVLREEGAERVTYLVTRPEEFRADLALMNASAALAFAGAVWRGGGGTSPLRWTARRPPTGAGRATGDMRMRTYVEMRWLGRLVVWAGQGSAWRFESPVLAVTRASGAHGDQAAVVDGVRR
jgi:hypothetical protein